jgi:hypothetical protein
MDKEEELEKIKESIMEDEERLIEAKRDLDEDMNKFRNYQDECER